MYGAEESLAYKLVPRVTKLTLKVFRRSAYVAFDLALQSFFEGDYRKCIHCSYNALRHLLRYEAGLRGCEVPISDREVINSAPQELRGFVAWLVEVKKCSKPGEEEVSKALAETFVAIATQLGLKAPDVKKVIETRRTDSVLNVSVCEERWTSCSLKCSEEEQYCFIEIHF